MSHNSSKEVRSPSITPKNTLTRKPLVRRADSAKATSRMPTTLPSEAATLLQQNHELRQRLHDEANGYRRRIDTYKQAQQNQANLVSRLQSKVLQYKQRCCDLEGRTQDMLKIPATNYKSSIQSPCSGNLETQSAHHLHGLPICSSLDSPSPPQCPRELAHHDHTDVCRTIKDEEFNYNQLFSQNVALRQQLEESTKTNEILSNDLQKLSTDWENLRDELVVKEDQFKEEEQVFNDYYSGEHNRLLQMWRDVVAVKRSFNEMQLGLKSELNRMRTDFTGANRDLSTTCHIVISNAKQICESNEQQQYKAKKDSSDLKNEIEALKAQYDVARQEINQRDLRLQELMQQLKHLEERCAQAEAQASQNNRLNDEIERLNGALRDIAHAVVQDAESTDRICDNSAAAQIIQLSQSGLPPKSPRRGSARTCQAFAESTISAVQATLHKYQLALHDLQVTKHTTMETLNSTRKQLKASEDTRNALMEKLSQLTEKHDLSNSKILELVKERDNLQKTLDATKCDKQSIEKSKAELNVIFDGLSMDFDKLQNFNGKLQKTIDELEEDKKALEMEMTRILKDREISEINLRSEEDRTSQLREETISLREELNRIYLNRDLLEQQRLESDNLINILEKQKTDLEFDIDKLLIEKTDLQDRVEKLSSNSNTTAEDIKNLQDHLTTIEEELKSTKIISNNQEKDMNLLKKDLAAAEQTRFNTESEKLSVKEKLKFCEIEKDKLEQELACVTRDRTDIHNQLTAVIRMKESTCEELVRMRQRLEQTSETNNRLNRNLEDLVKVNEERQCIIEQNDKEIQRLQELLASLRSEKEALEAVLFNTNTSLEATEEKRNQLEHDIQELLVKQETFKNQVSRLTKDLEIANRRSQEIKIEFNNTTRSMEAEHQQKIANLKGMSEEQTRKYNEDKDNIRINLEKRMQQALLALQMTKDDEIEKLQERLENLQAHLESTIQQHDEILIRAENEKQQALMMAHRDKQAIIEKLETSIREVKTQQELLDRLRREFAGKDDKNRNCIAQLKDELAASKTKAEELKTKLEEEVKKLGIQLSTLAEERDVIVRQRDELQIEVRLKEDKVNNLNCQLQDALRKLKEGDNNIESIRKDLNDTRRALADSNIERDKYSNSNKELRDHVKRAESDKREHARTVEEALQKLSTLDELKNTLENEKIRLSTLLKETQNNFTKTQQELQITKQNLQKLQMEGNKKDADEKELHSQLKSETEDRDRAHQELQQVKKQMNELEVNLCSTRQELGRVRCQANQDEHGFHVREQELCARLEECRGKEKRLEDQKHNLEVCLADATQQIHELKARIGGAEGRVRALEEQLSVTEALKRDCENKLSSIAQTLRRIAGIQYDGSVNHSLRIMSPSRRYSPVRGNCGHDYETRSISNCADGPIDVDPELIRKGVRSLMHQIAQIEREKDDFKAQLNATKKQLADTSEQQAKCETKLTKVQQMLRSSKEEISNLEAQFKIKSSSFNSMEDTLKQKTEESQLLREKLSALEITLNREMEEKGQIEGRLDKSRQQSAKLEADKRQLQDELTRTESKSSKLDLQRVSLEGDITRLQMALQEKDCNIRQTQERLENQNRALVQLEDRCLSLKTTVDQMKERLQKTSSLEGDLRAELNTLGKEKSELGHSIQAMQEKLKQLKKTLQTVDNEKRIVSERLETSQNVVNELRRNQQAQQDSVQRLQEQVADLEVQRSALESQLRIDKWNHENNEPPFQPSEDNNLSRELISSQREKSELRNKLETLKNKIKQLEIEKHSSKFAGVSHEFDKPEKKSHSESAGESTANRLEFSNYSKANYNCGLDHSFIEQENRDLRMKVRRLETQLAEKEAELARAKAKLLESSKCLTGDSDRYRIAQTKAEHLLDAREQAHRQQIFRLENQISLLREQLAQETKHRQQYILRSSKANREMKHLRHTLGDSLRHVSQHPLDPLLLENESRRLDTAVSMSLPPSTFREYDRSLSPRK